MTIPSALLMLLILGVWLFFAAGASTSGGSDAAGNAMSNAFTTLSGIALWILLTIFLLMAGLRRGFPAWATVAAIVLVPASAVAALRTVDLLSGNYNGKWPLVVPCLAPLLILAYGIWVYLPAVRVAIPSGIAGGVLWGGVLILSILPWPTIQRTSRETAKVINDFQIQANKEQAQRDAKDLDEWKARFEKLPPNPSLFQLSEFTRHGDELRKKAFDAIQKLPTRQSDAEDLLTQGVGWPLVELPHLNLEATPSLCNLSCKFLAGCAKSISPPVPGRPYDWEKNLVDPYLPAMQWLWDRHCDCSAEIAAVENAVRAYPRAADRDRTLAILTTIRQSKR